MKFRNVITGFKAYNSVETNLLHNILTDICNTTIKRNNQKSSKKRLKFISILQDVISVKHIKTIDFYDLLKTIGMKYLHKTIGLVFKEYKSQLNLKEYFSVRFFKTLLNFTSRCNYIIYNNNYYKPRQGISQGCTTSTVLYY